MRSPTSFCHKLRTKLLKKGIHISISAVSRRVTKKFGLKLYKPAAKPRLTSAMKKKRVSFASKRLHWTVENGKKFYFLTNPMLSNSQYGRDTFEDQNVKDLN